MNRISTWPLLLLGALVAALSLAAGLSSWQPVLDHPQNRLDEAAKKLGGQNIRPLYWDTNAYEIAFTLKSCPRPVTAIVLSVDFEDEPFLEKNFSPGAARTFVYLDRRWTHLDHLIVWSSYVRALGQNLLLPYTRPYLNHIVEVVSDAPCAAAQTYDWREEWAP